MATAHRPVTSELPLTTSSGLMTVGQSGTVVLAKPGILMSAIAYTDGTNTATLTVYDNATTVTGTELSYVLVKGDELMGGETQAYRTATNGITIKLSGTGGSALIAYMI